MKKSFRICQRVGFAFALGALALSAATAPALAGDNVAEAEFMRQLGQMMIDIHEGSVTLYPGEIAQGLPAETPIRSAVCHSKTATPPCVVAFVPEGKSWSVSIAGKEIAKAALPELMVKVRVLEIAGVCKGVGIRTAERESKDAGGKTLELSLDPGERREVSVPEGWDAKFRCVSYERLPSCKLVTVDGTDMVFAGPVMLASYGLDSPEAGAEHGIQLAARHLIAELRAQGWCQEAQPAN